MLISAPNNTSSEYQKPECMVIDLSSIEVTQKISDRTLFHSNKADSFLMKNKTNCRLVTKWTARAVWPVRAMPNRWWRKPVKKVELKWRWSSRVALHSTSARWTFRRRLSKPRSTPSSSFHCTSLLAQITGRACCSTMPTRPPFRSSITTCGCSAGHPMAFPDNPTKILATSIALFPSYPDPQVILLRFSEVFAFSVFPFPYSSLTFHLNNVQFQPIKSSCEIAKLEIKEIEQCWANFIIIIYSKLLVDFRLNLNWVWVCLTNLFGLTLLKK